MKCNYAAVRETRSMLMGKAKAKNSLPDCIYICNCEFHRRRSPNRCVHWSWTIKTVLRSNWIHNGIAPFKWHAVRSCSCSRFRLFPANQHSTQQFCKIVSLNQVFMQLQPLILYIYAFSAINNYDVQLVFCLQRNYLVSFYQPLRDFHRHGRKKRWSYRYTVDVYAIFARRPDFHCLQQTEYLSSSTFFPRSLHVACWRFEAYEKKALNRLVARASSSKSTKFGNNEFND